MKQMINLKEYRLGKEKKNAKRLGRESADAVAKGDAAVYSRNVGKLSKGKQARTKLNSFQKSFEKGVKEEEDFNEQPTNNLVGEIRLSETQLLQVIKESVHRILNEILR